MSDACIDQLWGNLPSSLKMVAPRYQAVKSHEIPEIIDDDGPQVRVVCGNFWERKAQWRELPPIPSTSTCRSLPAKERRFQSRQFVMHSPMCSQAAENSAMLRVRSRCRPRRSDGSTPILQAANRSRILFDRGDEVTVPAGDDGVRFLLVSGKPLEEPVAWYGSIVMNTQEQLRQAFMELLKEQS